MSETVSFLKPKATNPATNPVVDEVVRANIAVKRANALELLHAIAEEHGEVTFANSFGAEDMVLTDLILAEALPIEIFSLDTGRLPAETYALMGEVEKRYDARLKVYFPDATAVETYVRSQGINAFYESVELRKQCCAIRKVEPLKRALAGKQAWITGMRAAQSATRTELPVRQFDEANGLAKYNPLSDWSEQEVWAYIRIHGLPYNALHDQFYPSIGCAPCTRAIAVGEDVRAGRWWWEDPANKECGLHKK
ncbi:phosphoadenylyl-sulfate reductase [Uliginosibacterium flavum]|uniref:Adenosine 5'-phosphosulfate reductase n=1 Tax=Uliginosibacterium flavum TaxID=1396831 RepID=A0ABV2TPY0_9RHOO